MNTRIWPNYSQIPAVNIDAKEPSELAQALAAVQMLLNQFNELSATQGEVARQIQAIANKLRGIYPFDGERDAGYLTHAMLQNWPLEQLVLARGGLPYVVVTMTDTPSVAFPAAAGSLFVLSGTVSLDAESQHGIQMEGADTVLYATGGLVRTAEKFRPGGYQSADGTDAVSKITGNATFKDGLLTDGSIMEDAPIDADFYVRYNPGPELANAAWVSLGAFFADLSLEDLWPGGEQLTKLGTVDTGVWEGTTIGVEFGGTGLDGVGTPGQALVVDETGESLTYVTLDTVPESPADAEPYVRFNSVGPGEGFWQSMSVYFQGISGGQPWTGATSIDTVGTITTGTWQGSVVGVEYGGTGLTSLGSAGQALLVNEDGTGLTYGNAMPELGAANSVLGVDAAGTGPDWKSIVGTTNRITVTHSAGGVTFSAPQDLHTSASPTFASARFTGGYITLG